MDRYTSTDGKVPWRQVFTEHPEWAKTLQVAEGKTIPVEIHKVAYEIRRARKKEERRNGKNVAKNNFKSTGDEREERKELLRRLLRAYPAEKGKIPWEKALADHPDWRKQLQWDDRAAQSRSFAMARAIIRKEPAFVTYRPARRRQSKKAAALVEKTPTAVEAGMAVIKSDGVEITFSKTYLPDVLHTLAFALSGQKPHKL